MVVVLLSLCLQRDQAFYLTSGKRMEGPSLMTAPLHSVELTRQPFLYSPTHLITLEVICALSGVNLTV